MSTSITEPLSRLEAGRTVLPGRETACAEAPWSPHPAFGGVSLKHLVTGADTSGRLSVHLVRIDPGCVIGEHIHQAQHEIHEVLAGQGSCVADGRSIDYTPGVRAVIPESSPHAVAAAGEGLLILATFAPALV